MMIAVHPRAEIQLRFLNNRDEASVRRSLKRLETATLEELQSEGKVHKLDFPASSLYSHRATPRLRLLFSRRPKGYLIEDVMDHERLDSLPGAAGKA